MRTLLNRGYLTVALALLAPASFFIAKNYTQYTPFGNALSLVLAAGLGLAVALVCWLAVLALRRFTKLPAESGGLWEYGACTVGFCLLFPFFTLLFWFGQTTPSKVLVSALAVAAFYFLARVVTFKVLNVFLLAFTAISFWNILTAEFGEKDDPLPPPAAIPNTFAMARKPNIYFFLLESFHDRDTIREEYGFDDPELFDLLPKEGFREYDHFYSNYMGTLETCLALLSMRHHYDAYHINHIDFTRTGFDLLAENNVFKILKHNGYRIHMFDTTGRYVFRNASPLVDFTDFSQELRPLDVTWKTLAPFNPFLGEIVNDLRIGYYDPKAPVFPETFANHIGDRANLDGGPNFFYLHFGAYHIMEYSNFYPKGWPGPIKDWEGTWPEYYRDRYLNQGSKWLLACLDAIRQFDPDAMIVLSGDHGGWKYGRELEMRVNPDFLDGKADINAYFRAHGVEPRVVGRNLASVLTAIRWPDGVTPQPKPSRGLSHVTLFPFIFSHLSDIPYNQDLFEDNVSIGLIHKDDRFMVLARDGRLLDNWELSVLRNGKLVPLVHSQF